MLKADHLLRGCSSSQASGQRETGDIMPWAWASTAAACRFLLSFIKVIIPLHFSFQVLPSQMLFLSIKPVG